MSKSLHEILDGNHILPLQEGLDIGGVGYKRGWLQEVLNTGGVGYRRGWI